MHTAGGSNPPCPIMVEVLQLIVDSLMLVLGGFGLWELFSQGEDLEDIEDELNGDEAP